jgi:hypothetical protein
MDMLSQSRKLNVPNLDRQMVKYAAAMEQCGWNAARIERVLGKNWGRLLGDVWAESPRPEAESSTIGLA